MSLHEDIAGQLCEELTAAAEALNAVLSFDGLLPGGMPAMYSTVRETADRLAAQLLSEDEQLAAQTVIDLANALNWDTNDPHWWRTPLGQAVASSVGHPSASVVSHELAGAMLGVTKQAVTKLAAKGRLERGSGDPHGGITVVSVRRLLAERAR